MFLKSDRIRIDKFTDRSITPEYILWLNDPEINMYMNTGRFPVSEKDVYAPKDQKNLLFMIRYLSEKDSLDPYIGTASLHSIDWISRKAEIGYMIGDKGYWGKGIATEVVKILCDYAFFRLNLNKVTAGVVAENIGSMRALEKNDFKLYATNPKDYFVNGKFLDSKRYFKLQENHINEIT